MSRLRWLQRLRRSTLPQTDRPAGSRCPPAPPPPDLRIRLHILDWPAGLHLTRLHLADKGALEFGVRQKGANRFDPLGDPWSSTAVLYAGTSLEVAIAETLLRWHGQIRYEDPVILSNAQLRVRKVASFVPRVGLRLIDGSGLGLAMLELAVARVMEEPQYSSRLATTRVPIADDIFQCGAEDYWHTQRWGAWMRAQCPNADGITWISRQFNRAGCLVLFADRCMNELYEDGESQPLLDGGKNEEVLDKLLAKLGWGRE